MSPFRWLASPLTGTAGVFAALGLLAVPLHRLTSAPQVKAPPAPAAVPADAGIPAVLRLKLLAPAKRVAVEDAGGRRLIDLAEAGAGESEHDAVILLENGHLDLTLRADFGDTESAAFLTVMPDGREDQTRYLIGSGESSETLTFAWPAH